MLQRVAYLIRFSYFIAITHLAVSASSSPLADQPFPLGAEFKHEQEIDAKILKGKIKPRKPKLPP